MLNVRIPSRAFFGRGLGMQRPVQELTGSSSPLLLCPASALLLSFRQLTQHFSSLRISSFPPHQHWKWCYYNDCATTKSALRIRGAGRNEGVKNPETSALGVTVAHPYQGKAVGARWLPHTGLNSPGRLGTIPVSCTDALGYGLQYEHTHIIFSFTFLLDDLHDKPNKN